MAHRVGHAGIAQAGPPAPVEEDPELLEVVDLDVVDLEVRIMERSAGYGSTELTIRIPSPVLVAWPLPRISRFEIFTLFRF